MEQRKDILRAVLRLEKVGEDVSLLRLAKLTEGWSGSDLRELCRAGSMRRVREMAAEEEELRAVTMEDMLAALAKMRESRLEVCCTITLCFYYTITPLHHYTITPSHHYTITPQVGQRVTMGEAGLD